MPKHKEAHTHTPVLGLQMLNRLRALGLCKAKHTAYCPNMGRLEMRKPLLSPGVASCWSLESAAYKYKKEREQVSMNFVTQAHNPSGK